MLEMKKLKRMVKIRKFLINNRNRGGLVLSLILMFSSCGITVLAYLNPPVKLGNLSFYHAYNNDPDNALGYEFFYRIYDEDAIIDSATVINEANNFFVESNLLRLLSSNRILITDSDYKRILPVSDNLSTDYKTSLNPIPTVSPPLMPVDDFYFDKDGSGLRFTVSVAITGLTHEGEISTSGYIPGAYPSTINFKRYVTEDSFDFTDVTLLDVDAAQDDVPPGDITTFSIAFFVVLYGLDNDYISLFSDVVYIGSLDGLLAY